MKRSILHPMKDHCPLRKSVLFPGGWISVAIMTVIADIGLRKLHAVRFDKFNRVI